MARAQGTHRKPATWDKLVNERWGGQQPVLPPEEAIKAAKRLYRKAMGKPFKGEVRLTSGRRYTYVRRGVLFVNPDCRQRDCRGLRAMIHDISHYCHRRLHPNDAPHSRRQAVLEGKLVTYALNSGFLEGRLAAPVKEPAAATAPAPKPDKVVAKYRRILGREAKWMAQLEQAQRLLKKAQRERREYERRHGERVTGAVQ